MTLKNIAICALTFSTFSCQNIIVPTNIVSKSLNQNIKLNIEPSEQTVPSELSLYKAKELAVAGNPDLQAAGQRILKAKAIIEQARSLYSPRISASAGASHDHHRPIAFGSTDSRENYSASLNASWLVYDGFAREYKVLSAQYGEIASQESYRDAQRLLIDAVAQAFYQTIFSAKEMAINLELKEINEKFLNDTKIKEEAGTSTKTEVNNFLVNRNDSHIRYLASKTTFETAKLALLELLGLPEADSSFNTIYKTNEITVPDYKTAIATALNNRPDLKVLQANILGAEAQIKEAKADYHPKVSIEGSLGAQTINDAGFQGEDRASSIGIGMSWDLYTGNSTAALINQRKAEKEELLKTLKANWNEIISQIRQQRLSLINDLEIAKLQSESARLSESIYEDTKQVYENGATTITRVNEVLTDYSISKVNQALYEVQAIRRKEVLNALLGINNLK